MGEIKFTEPETAILIKKIQMYFDEELDQDIKQFPARFLLDFFIEEIGPYFYNQALLDAQTLLEEKMEGMREALYEIEKPTEFDR